MSLMAAGEQSARMSSSHDLRMRASQLTTAAPVTASGMTLRKCIGMAEALMLLHFMPTTLPLKDRRPPWRLSLRLPVRLLRVPLPVKPLQQMTELPLNGYRRCTGEEEVRSRSCWAA